MADNLSRRDLHRAIQGRRGNRQPIIESKYIREEHREQISPFSSREGVPIIMLGGADHSTWKQRGNERASAAITDRTGPGEGGFVRCERVIGLVCLPYRPDQSALSSEAVRGRRFRCPTPYGTSGLHSMSLSSTNSSIPSPVVPSKRRRAPAHQLLPESFMDDSSTNPSANPGHIPKRGARACTACRKGKNRCEGEVS